MIEPWASATLPAQAPPLLREHRLYQSDWLMRFYGFQPKEVAAATDEATGMLPLDIDPKLAWALKHRAVFPVDVNRAPREMLPLKMPVARQPRSQAPTEPEGPVDDLLWRDHERPDSAWVFRTLIPRNSADGQPWLTAATWPGCALPQLNAPPRRQVDCPPTASRAAQKSVVVAW